MSRFYDALKEAGRSSEVSQGQPPAGALESGAPVLSDVLAEESQGASAAQMEENAQKISGPKLDTLHEDLLHLAGIPTIAAAPQNEAPRRVAANDVISANGTTPNVAESSDPPSGEGSSPAAAPFQAKTEIAFDPSARLIPQAVDSVVVEHYRRLRTKIFQQHAAKPFQILMVSSPNPQEGKTVTVLNLGFSFAMLPNFKVLVIDGDLRRGTIGKWLGADDYPGLSDVLEGAARLEDVAIKCANVSMHVVTRGKSKVSPAELLHSPELRAQFRRMTQHFDLVLVDSPPVTLMTDAQLLAGSCDAVLLIARAFQTKRKSLEQAVQDLSAFRVIGTVLNGGTRTQLYHGYSGYY